MQYLFILLDCKSYFITIFHLQFSRGDYKTDKRALNLKNRDLLGYKRKHRLDNMTGSKAVCFLVLSLQLLANSFYLRTPINKYENTPYRKG